MKINYIVNMPTLNIYKAKTRSDTVVQTYYLGGLGMSLRKNGQIRISYNFGKNQIHDHTDIHPGEDYYDFFRKMIKLAR